MLADEGVMRAAQHQRVDVPGLSAKQAHSPRMTCARSYYFCSVFKAGTAFDGVCQAVAGLPARAASSAWNRALAKVLRVAITPMIGRLGYTVRSRSMLEAVAVLQAATSALMLWSTKFGVNGVRNCLQSQA